jgi:hypothetical protein
MGSQGDDGARYVGHRPIDSIDTSLAILIVCLRRVILACIGHNPPAALLLCDLSGACQYSIGFAQKPANFVIQPFAQGT